MPVKLCNDWCLPVPASSASVLEIAKPVPEPPLSVDEVMACLRQRWRATYDLQLVVRRRRLYLQVMWAYLEQQSFPMDLEAYRQHLGEVLDVVNRLGLAAEVRQWITTTRDKPRLGKALSIQLQAEGPAAEVAKRGYPA